MTRRIDTVEAKDLMAVMKSLKKEIRAHKWSQQNYEALSECVENGIKGGWYKAHKHTDKPTEEVIFEMLNYYVMLEIAERFKFE
jgi:hypothetical protein